MRMSDWSADVCSAELTAEAMALAIRHRGPDAEGTWIDPEAGLAFGHCRLSIVDLSAAGAQPMLSPSGRYVISYNGEIFNFQALRQILAQHGQRSEEHTTELQSLMRITYAVLCFTKQK